MTHSERKSMKLLRSYFLTYAAVLLIPVIAACISQLMAMQSIRVDIESDNQVLLQQAGSILDLQMKELNDIGTQMANNTILSSLRSVENPLDYPNINAYFRMQDALPSHRTMTSFLYDYFLFFNKGQLALNDRHVYSYDDLYSLYMHSPGQSLEAWKQEIETVPVSGSCRLRHVRLLEEEPSREATLIAISFPFLPYSSKDGQIVLYVDQQMFLDLLQAFQLQDHEIAYIESPDGVILASLASDDSSADALKSSLAAQPLNVNLLRTRIDQKDILASRFHSDQTGFNIVIGRSTSRVYARLTTIQYLVGLALVFALLLGILFSYMFSRQNSRYLGRLVDDTQLPQLNQMSYSRAFQRLRQTFEDIQIANDSMEKALTNQQAYLKKSFLSQLLNGDFSDEEKALAIARNIPSFHPNAPMRVLLLHFSSDSGLSGDAAELQLSVNCTAVIRLSIDSLEPDALRTSRSDSDYVILLCGDQLSERIDRLVGLIRSNLPEDINSCLFAYAGEPVDRLLDVVRSWESACSMIYIQSSPDEVPVQYFRESGNARFEVFYPQDLQKRLINCVMNDDIPGMEEILNLLKEKNTQGTDMPAYIAHLLVNSLISTLLQINTLADLPQEYSERILSRLMEIMAMPGHAQLEQVHQLYGSLCESIRQNKSDLGKSQAMDEITDYIQNHYMDPDISLTSVADLFHVSESYLSFTFKAQKGINFFTYLEDLRIAHAKSLLRQTNLKISEIAEQSGYASANSFCRAFKRKTGISASSYRNDAEA